MAVHPRAAERVVLDVRVGHPRGGDRRPDADALVVGVHRNREPELVRRRPERIVCGAAVRDARAAGKEDADELVPTPEPADLTCRRLGVLGGDDEHPSQARLLL